MALLPKLERLASQHAQPAASRRGRTLEYSLSEGVAHLLTELDGVLFDRRVAFLARSTSARRVLHAEAVGHGAWHLPWNVSWHFVVPARTFFGFQILLRV